MLATDCVEALGLGDLVEDPSGSLQVIFRNAGPPLGTAHASAPQGSAPGPPGHTLGALQVSG